MDMEVEHIFKGDIELIVAPYSDGKRWYVAVFNPNGNNKLEFPFKTKEEAKKWISEFEYEK